MSSPYIFFEAEDGIRDVAVTGVQTCALPIYRLARDHAAHREVLARVAEERDHLELRQPLVVVHEHRRGGAAPPLEVALDLPLQPVRPLGHPRLGIERALAGLAARIADQAGAAADQHDGAVAR